MVARFVKFGAKFHLKPQGTNSAMQICVSDVILYRDFDFDIDRAPRGLQGAHP